MLARKVGAIVVVAVVLVCIVILATTGSRSNQESTVQPPAATTDRATPPPVNTVPAQPPKALDGNTAQLEARVKAFVQAYFAQKPDDTSEARRARVAPFASAQFLRDHSLTADRTTEAGKARIAQGLTTTGTADMSSIIDNEYEDVNQPVRDVQVVVNISTHRSDGTVVQESVASVQISMVWERTDDWYILTLPYH